MTSEQHQFTAQGRTFPVILVRKKVKTSISTSAATAGCTCRHRPVSPGLISRISWKRRRTSSSAPSAKWKNGNKNFPILTLSDGDTLYLAGQPYRLDVRLGLHNSIRRSGQTVFMELADDTPVMRQKLYHKLLQALGKKLFPASLSRMQPLFAGLALPDPVLKQRVMRSRWGSCMPLKGIVTMNTYLAIMPEAIIDHVMLHELCQFSPVPNHSRHFYDAMTIRMPDWKARRQAMAKYLPYCV